MNPLASFAFLIATVQSLAAAVTTRDDLHLRPAFSRKAVASRLVSGLRVLRAFLRRLIILMALELEWSLVDARGQLKRPHGRKSKRSYTVSLAAFDAPKASPWLNGGGPQFKPTLKSHKAHWHDAPLPVGMARLYAQLDYLSKLAANPLAKAKRLAFHFARSYQGIIMVPKGPERIAGYWGTDVRACYDGIGGSIVMKSRNRPPPLAPPRTHWPTITAI